MEKSKKIKTLYDYSYKWYSKIKDFFNYMECSQSNLMPETFNFKLR